MECRTLSYKYKGSSGNKSVDLGRKKARTRVHVRINRGRCQVQHGKLKIPQQQDGGFDCPGSEDDALLRLFEGLGIEIVFGK